VSAPLLPVDEALARLLADVRVIAEVEECPLQQALGRVLAQPVAAAVDVPPWDNSAMDGYALRAADLERAPATLAVSQRVAAGAVPQPLVSGTAARIFTGAPLPPGADAVIMQENTRVQGGRVECLQRVRCGENVRRQGQDLAAGQVVAAAGQRLSAIDLGLLASVGVSRVNVTRRPRVTLLSTGDELLEPGQALPAGKIYNSNRYLLQGLLQALGCDCRDHGIVADTAVATREALQRAAADSDLVLTTGGVSVGEEDHVRAQVEALGEIKVWKLAIKPGKPLAYGRVGTTPLLGLPGNPASVLVTFCLLARPWLLRLAGATDVLPARMGAVAGFDWPRAGTRQEYLRVRVQVDEQGITRATLAGNQSSGVLSSAARANALAEIPAGASFKAGARIQVLLLSDLLH